MKKKIISYFLLLFSTFVFSQNEQLAQNYFDKGDFEKAVLMFEDLVKAQPNNFAFLQKHIICLQQMKQYEKAQEIILSRIEKTKQPNLYVDLGYNYQLQKNTDKAKKYYKMALEKIKENPNNVYTIAQNFEQKTLIEQAIEAYNLGMVGNPNSNFDYQIALLQGQIGNTELMTDKLLDFAFKNPTNLNLVQNQLTRFISENSNENFTDYLKKALLLRTQQTQEVFWNQFMSWFFVQQKEYGKAFIQEKAIFKRNPDNFGNIVNLAKLTIEENETETSRTILDFILLNTDDAELQLEAQYQLINLDIDKAKVINFPIISEKLNQLIAKFGISPNTTKLQILKAHFEAFYLNQLDISKKELSATLELPLNNYQKSDVKMELADVLLLDQKFNQAIIYYAQIEDDLKNDEIAHEASFKMAKASYLKGDFEWAQQQFKVLKSSTSQLIANDAMEMFLLINDNTVEDSTQVALKQYAKADYLLYQNKNTEALALFKTIVEQNKGKTIEDETLLKIAQLYEKQADFAQAILNYQEIIEKHKDGIYIDEALFFSAEIYRKQIPDIEKAKAHYEKIIFGHQDSIYFVDARNYYRKLRGDTNL
jgi:tetratricopeptide (TPR) repeat protein